jgi:hypothetical protein
MLSSCHYDDLTIANFQLYILETHNNESKVQCTFSQLKSLPLANRLSMKLKDKDKNVCFWGQGNESYLVTFSPNKRRNTNG